MTIARWYELSDVSLPGMMSGGHSCVVFGSEAERQSVVAGFLSAGLEGGDKVLYLADAPDTTCEWLRGLGIRTYRGLASERSAVDGAGRAAGVLVLPAESVYCPDGRFDPNRMLAELERAACEARHEGYRSLRVTGETGWAVGQARLPGAERLEEYEAMVDAVLHRHQITAMCQYDVAQWTGDSLYRLLSLHRHLVVRGRVLENPSPAGAGEPEACPSSALVLGRLLLAQVVLATLESPGQMAQFVETMLLDLPGVVGGSCDLFAEPAPLRLGAQREPSRLGFGVEAKEEQGRLLLLDLATTSARYGRLLIEFEESSLPPAYRASFRNFGTALALLCEKHWLQAQTEGALAQSEERYRAIFRTMQNGCSFSQMIYDEQGHPVDWLYLAVNPALERILGCSELEGRRMTDVFPGMNDPLPRLLEIYGRVATTGESERFELEMPRLGKWMEISASSPFPGHFMAVYTDITERRRLEQHLRQVEKMEAVGQLAGGIAHDFNNLLTAILGYSELLGSHEAVIASGLQEDVLAITQAAQRGAALTRQMLAFARREEIKPQTVSINEILLGIAPLLRRSLGEHIELVLSPQPDLGLVEADSHQIERVIMNLALNAKDAMPDGGRLVIQTADVELGPDYCRTRGDVSPGPYVMLTVTDTGCGMEESILEHIFEPFFTTKRPGEGTGLGLSTVYGIVRQSGGHIAVESSPGKGSTFRIYLPRKGRESRSSEDSGPGLTGERGAGKGQVIVVVEDEGPVRELVRRILVGEGYQVLAFGCPTDALEMLRENGGRVDLLLSDVVLPGPMQGQDLADAALALRPGLPIVFMSGYTREATLLGGRIDPEPGYLQKPFTREALVGEVRNRLQAAGPGGS